MWGWGWVEAGDLRGKVPLRNYHHVTTIYLREKKGVVIKFAQRIKMHFIGGGGYRLCYWLIYVAKNYYRQRYCISF